MNQKLGFLCFWGIHNSFPSFWAKLGYSRIKIDLLSLHVLYSIQFKIGVQHSQLNFCNSLLRLWEARALILLRSHLNGRDGQKAGRLFISGCIDRDGGWQIEHNSRILLILLSLFSKEEWRCVLFQFMKYRTLFRVYYWSLSESSQLFVCGSKQFHKRWAAKRNENFVSNLKKIEKWKSKCFHFL